MNDNSSPNRAQNRTPSDDQMDSLLQDFFRLEVPTELHQPRPGNAMRHAAFATVTVAPQHDIEVSRPRSVRFVAVAASVAAMALAVLVVITGNNPLSSNAGNIANEQSNEPVATPYIDNPMSVSPKGDSRTSANVVGSDGVTLEETDSIEMHPKK